MARPSSYTQKVAEVLCERIANGKSLRQICDAKDMPGITTVRRWLSDNESFRLQYARAREEQADFYADEIIEISDLAKAEDAQIARLRVDARKWKASKLAPKKYGDKMTLGGDENAPIGIKLIERTIVSPNTDS